MSGNVGNSTDAFVGVLKDRCDLEEVLEVVFRDTGYGNDEFLELFNDVENGIVEVIEVLAVDGYDMNEFTGVLYDDMNGIVEVMGVLNDVE